MWATSLGLEMNWQKTNVQALPYPINNSKFSWYVMSECHHLCSYANLDIQIWKSRIFISKKAEAV